VFGGVEAGGTKWVCAKGTGPHDLTEIRVIPTTTPPETLGRVIEFFKRDSVRVAALGVGSFGPVDLRVGSETFGWIKKTAKPGWSNTNVVGALIEELGVPVGFDTDVNAAALAEQRWGAARGLSNFIYMTVGTGIGPASSSMADPSTGSCIPSSATSSSRMTTPAIRSPVPARSIVTASRGWLPGKRCALATVSRPNSSMIRPPGRSRRATLRSGS